MKGRGIANQCIDQRSNITLAIANQYFILAPIIKVWNSSMLWFSIQNLHLLPNVIITIDYKHVVKLVLPSNRKDNLPRYMNICSLISLRRRNTYLPYYKTGSTCKVLFFGLGIWLWMIFNSMYKCDQSILCFVETFVGQSKSVHIEIRWHQSNFDISLESSL